MPTTSILTPISWEAAAATRRGWRESTAAWGLELPWREVVGIRRLVVRGGWVAKEGDRKGCRH